MTVCPICSSVNAERGSRGDAPPPPVRCTAVTARLLLVRHARPTANWDSHPDSGLDPTGRSQAEALAADLGEGPPRPLVVSPLRRTRETAAPLAARWGIEPDVRPEVGEIPSPTEDPTARGAWLREILAGTWAGVGPEITHWREQVLAALGGLADGTVVVSHFVAINAAVGHATGTDHIISFSPDHCSRTELEVAAGGWRVVSLGGEARTEVR